MKAGWKTVPLEALAAQQKGAVKIGPFGSQLKKSDLVSSGIHVVGIENVLSGTFDGLGERFISSEKFKTLRTVEVLPGDLLITMMGTIGKVAVVPRGIGTTIMDSHLLRVRPDQKLCITEYLGWAIQGSPAVQEVIEAKAHGAIMRGLNSAIVRSLPILLPPLLDQRRIVGILDEAFEGIATAKANAEKNLQNARALFGSALNAAIQGKLVPHENGDASVEDLLSQIQESRNTAIEQGRAKRRKTTPIDTDSGDRPDLPRSWKWTQLESLSVGISDGVHKTPTYVSDGIPFVTVKNLTAGPGIRFDDLNYITKADHEEFIKRTYPEKGDVLITKDGTIGVVRLIETDIEFSIFVSVALIKPVMRELGPYLAYALRAPCVQSQIVPQGAALKHLYLVDLRMLAIPLPPLSEQKRIVGRLDTLAVEAQRLESLYERKLAALEALKKSLLHQAFTDQLGTQAA